MPGIPKLLKKISRKNLRKDSTDQDAPPLPDYADGPYSDFPLNSARTSPTGSPRPLSNNKRSASDFGYFELPASRKPSYTGSVESLPPSRRPSHTGSSSEYTSSGSRSQSSPRRQPAYYTDSPTSPYSSADSSNYSYPRPRTMSSQSGHGASGEHRGRPGFVASPSQLSYAHFDVQLAYVETPQQTPAEKPMIDSPPSLYVLPDLKLDKPCPPLPPQLSLVPQEQEDDDFSISKDLQAAWTSASTEPAKSKGDRILLTMETTIAGAMAADAKERTLVANIKTGLQIAGALDAVESGFSAFMEGMPGLMKGLDEVAKLHPFIGVAVMAFKAVWALELKRRDNDKKILALHMEMKDMMAVLTQLRNVKDAEEVAPDGSTIKGRMQEIVKTTAEDIKACANACDTYTKKKLVIKLLKGPQYEALLVKFAGTFTKRRSEFEFALAIHTARAVDRVGERLGEVDRVAREVGEKMDAMMRMFQGFVQPEQREMMRLVEQKGGIQACQDNDKVLKELADLEAKSSVGTGAAAQVSAKGGAANSSWTLEDLKDDLMTDVEAAIEKNSQVFSRKFEVQKRQIVEELTQVVAREGDRVISAITAGPHDKIIDPDVHKIWKDMGWRTSVKSRHFVMALRDYYHENSEDTADAASGNLKPRNPDDWALAYLNVSRLQSISEAFDDDASGFITTAEANTFTSSRPLGWTLPHWIAFWAVGFHQAMSTYATKIRELIAKMFALRSLVLPANRSSVNGYLEAIYQGVVSLESGLAPCYVNEALQEKFKSYVESEEARLRGNLVAVDYDLDAANTLTLVTGQGRIERFALPVLYLLLERDFERFRICQKTVLHPDEMWDASDTIGWVVSACKERQALLLASFSSQKADIGQEFKNYAHGMFQYMNDPSGLWDAKVVLAQDFPDYPYDDALEAQDVDMQKVLNYPVGLEKLDFAAYNNAADQALTKLANSSSRPSSALKAMLGTWNGFTYLRNSVVPDKGMISMDLTANGSQRFQASSRSNMSDFTITGECSSTDKGDTVSFSFVQKFPARFSPLYFSGSFSQSSQSLSGTWGAESDSRTHDGVFVFKRLNPEYMCFSPAPAATAASKARSLWAFAISAARYAARRDMWSWSLIKEKTDNRKRFIQLYIRATKFGKPLNRSEEEELGLIKKTFTTADSRFYHSIAENKIRVMTSHDVRCDVCTGVIGGCRLTCLTCRLEETFDTVDFCDTPSCASVKVVPTGMTRAHLPGTHDILKLRRPVHLREFGKTHREGKRALAKARTFFTEAHEETSTSPRCAVCNVAVTQPCWYCVMCEDPSFICNSCESDPKKKHVFGYHDMYSHDLVRCQPLVEEVEVTLEDLFANLEQRFIQHEANTDQRLKSLEAKVDDRLLKVDTRLVQVEKLLERVLFAIERQ